MCACVRACVCVYVRSVCIYKCVNICRHVLCMYMNACACVFVCVYTYVCSVGRTFQNNFARVLSGNKHVSRYGLSC